MKFGQNAFVFWVPGFEFNFFYFFFFLLVYRGQLKLWVCEGGLKAVGGRGGGWFSKRKENKIYNNFLSDGPSTANY